MLHLCQIEFRFLPTQKVSISEFGSDKKKLFSRMVFEENFDLKRKNRRSLRLETKSSQRYGK